MEEGVESGSEMGVEVEAVAVVLITSWLVGV